MRVLRDMNLSKLIDEDAPLFSSLIDDLFPGNKLSSSSYKELQTAIEKSAQSLNLMNEKDWNLKVVQLYETSLVRHGIMTLGPTGSGRFMKGTQRQLRLKFEYLNSQVKQLLSQRC